MTHLYLFDEKGRASAYGIGTYIQNVVSVCINCSIPVTVVSVRESGDIRCTVSNEGVRYINIPALLDVTGQEVDLEEKKDRKAYCEYVVTALAPYISDTNSLIFHLNYTQDYFLAECLKNKYPECKVVVTVHYFTWCFALYGNTSQLAGIVMKDKDLLTGYEQQVLYSGLFEQQLFKVADYIISLSEFARQVLESFYEISPEKIWYIPNGIKDTYKKRDKKEIRRKYSIPDKEVMLLFVGRLDRIKGVDYLIRAFKNIASQIEHLHLYIIGDGHFKEYISLCNPIFRQITFCGKMAQEQVYDFYEMSNIGILPSMHEQCSYVAIEMMMHGLPIIGTTSTGLDEMIDEGVNGFKVNLHEKENEIDFPVEELSSILSKFIHQPSLEKYATQSRSIFLQRYTNSCLQNRLYQLYTFCFKGKEVTLQNAIKKTSNN